MEKMSHWPICSPGVRHSLQLPLCRPGVTMSPPGELQSPLLCSPVWHLTSLSGSKLGKSSLITVSYQHSTRCEAAPHNNHSANHCNNWDKNGKYFNFARSLKNCRRQFWSLIHQENKYWQIIQPRADIRDWPGRPITLNGPKLLFDHKLCELEQSWSTHVLGWWGNHWSGPRHFNTIYHPGGGSLRRC